MKKKIMAVTMVLAMALSLVMVVKTPIEAQAASKVKLNKKTIAVKTGNTVKLTVRSKSVDEVYWSSDNASIASVSGRGKVTGVSVGTTYVRARCKLYSGKTKKLKCKVIVKSGRYLKNPEPYQSFRWSTEPVNMVEHKYISAFKCIGDWSDAEAYYNLNGDYKNLTFTIGHVDGRGNTETTFWFIADGETIAEYSTKTEDLTYTMLPKKITLDVSNCVIFEIKYNTRYYGDNDYTIADLTFDKGHD